MGHVANNHSEPIQRTPAQPAELCPTKTTRTPICRSPLRVAEFPLGPLSDCPGIYFAAITSPDISNSTYTTGFTFNRKLLGSLIPHFTYGTSNLLVPFQ